MTVTIEPCLEARAAMETCCNTTPHSLRWRLLGTVSAVVLVMSMGGMNAAYADDSLGRFTLEIGSGLDNYGRNDETWFTSSSSPLKIGPRTGWSLDGKATFQPKDSDWIFSVAAQYGRAKNKSTSFVTSSGYSGASATHKEEHTVLDFEVGQDVGLGIFGGGTSIISGGVRYAHFDARTDASFFYSSGDGGFYSGHAKISRSFTGVGPIVSWDGSLPIFQETAPLSLDMGVDGAVLFGTQKVKFDVVYSSGSYSNSRSKSVTVPAVDAYAAISYHFAGPDAKISLGYRLDSYFGVLDGGFETHQSVDRIFYGPYLKVGIAIE